MNDIALNGYKYSSIYSNGILQNLEFSFRTIGDLEETISLVKQKGQFIGRYGNSQITEYAFPQGKIIVEEIRSPDIGDKLKVEVFGIDLYQSTILLREVGLLR